MPMATTDRHNELTSSLFGEIYDLFKKREIHALQSDCALVHWGQRDKNELTSLIDVKDKNDIEDIDDFLEIIILELDYVKPDFMLFKDNPYLRNERGTRRAGQPDLIVEIWSRSNTKRDKEFLRQLYATSAITEFWQIEQDSNVVKCSMGKTILPDQSLTNILKTQRGIEFDLRHLKK